MNGWMDIIALITNCQSRCSSCPSFDSSITAFISIGLIYCISIPITTVLLLQDS
jgi:hypothetical protein